MSSPINATTAPDTGLRSYRFNDRDLISVTSIRRVIGMPFPLANWQVSQVIKAAETMRGTAMESALTEDEYRTHVRKAGMQERDLAAALGTSVHAAAEQGVKAASLSGADERKPFLAQYERWVTEMRPRILWNEGQCFNLSEGYAGSFDLIADMPGKHPEDDSTRYLIDLKTGKGVYNDHALQLALYFGAEFVGGYDAQEDRDVAYEQATELLNSCDSMAVLHLRPDSYEFIPIPLTDELAAAALDMVHLCRFFTNHPDIQSLKGDIYCPPPANR
jgi:hypothetical protein